jgi:hypothetical protein
MGARHGRDSTHAKRRARSRERRRTRKDGAARLSDAAAEMIERERRNLQRACALLDCLRIAAMYGNEREIEPGDVAYVVKGLLNEALSALDCVRLHKSVRAPSQPP